MPFGLKRTTGISGHYSEAWAICSAAQSRSVQEPVEASGSHGSHHEAVEDMWETRKGSEGVREVRERCGRSGRAVGKCGRGGKAWEVMVRYSTSLLRPSP